MSVNSKLTAIADKIRSLVGLSEKMGLDAMSSNLGEAVNECDTQADLITQIRTALAEKAAGGGGVELPDIAEEDLGTASDLAEGKQLIGADGEVITGSVTRYTNDDTYTFIGTEVGQGLNNKVGIWRTTDKAEMMDAGTSYGLYAEGSNFGDAGPGDVRAGKTFTSKEGLKITGTLEVGVQLPTIAQDMLGTAEDLVQDKQLIGSDGTVVTGKMPDRGDVQVKIDGLTTTSYTIPAGRHNGSGTVSLTNDIENALAAI